MCKKIYKVLVRDATNEYILGRISGVLLALTNTKDCRYYAMTGDSDNPKYRMIRVETTRWRFNVARKIIEQHYPEYCLFM